MFFDYRRTGFLRPRDRLFELLALQHFAESGGSDDGFVDSTVDRRTLKGYASTLQSSGFIEPSTSGGFQLTDAGRLRARYLLIDYVRELRLLSERAHDILRRSLAPLALAGVRRVALYPVSETAEVAAEVLGDLGLELVAVIDDDPEKHGARFRHLRIEGLDSIPDKRVDAIIVTTAVFRDRIVARIGELRLQSVRVHAL